MLEFAKYLKLKSLRNSIILFGIFVLTFKANDLKENIWPKTFILLVIFMWGYLYFSINHKVKLLKSGSKNSDDTIENRIKILKQAEGILSLLLVICVFANLRGWWIGSTFIVLPISMYLMWNIYSYSLVYTFFKRNSIESE